LLAFSPRHEECGGVLRWDYKICIDAEGQRLLELPAKSTSISRLNQIERPASAELHNQRADAEKQKVMVSAYVIECGKEEDGDYHLVLKSDSTDDTLIAEIPDPDCPKVSGFPFLVYKYTKARQFVRENIDNTPGRITPLQAPLHVRVTGIVLFDKMAHGNGHSPYGIEIHPVLEIENW
jgi:hypothetical protein